MCNINIGDSLNPRKAVVRKLHCTLSFTMTWIRPLSNLGMKVNSPKLGWTVSIKGAEVGELHGVELTCLFIQARNCESQETSNMMDQPFQCGGLPGASSWGPQEPAWMATWRHLRPDSKGWSSQCTALFCFVNLRFCFPSEGTHFWSFRRAKASVTFLPSKQPHACQAF